jgi:hypothetical protein
LAGVTAAVGGSTRRLTESQMFSKLFYAEKIKPVIEQAVIGQVVDQKMLVSLRAKYAVTIYESESEEVKEVVRSEIEKVEKEKKDAREALRKMSEVTTDDDLKPEDYMRCVLTIMHRK